MSRLTLDLLLLAAAGLGHLALWVALFNWLHATPLPRRLIKLLEKVLMALTAAIPLFAAWQLASRWALPLWPPANAAAAWFGWAYLLLCWLAALHWTAAWVRRRLHGPCPQLVQNDTQLVHVDKRLGRPPLGDRTTRLLWRIPGNEIFQLSIHEKQLRLPRLPAALHGLTITHLTDLHFYGGIEKDYFQVVVDEANQLGSDLMVITGDIIDRRKCLDWLDTVLGRLRAPHGVYFVLGNHDTRLHDTSLVRRTLSDAGLIDMGGRCRTLTIRGRDILLAGNERPWFRALPPLPVEREQAADAPLKVLLAHTPDQYGWARRHDFDLMLAGHTHGGQIRLPLLGPLVSPSYHGVKYASGVFFDAPTLMHVSRGISALHPIRLNCPPELAKLVLCQPGVD